MDIFRIVLVTAGGLLFIWALWHFVQVNDCPAASEEKKLRRAGCWDCVGLALCGIIPFVLASLGGSQKAEDQSFSMKVLLVLCALAVLCFRVSDGMQSNKVRLPRNLDAELKRLLDSEERGKLGTSRRSSTP